MQNPQGMEQEADPVTAATIRIHAKEICREPKRVRKRNLQKTKR